MKDNLPKIIRQTVLHVRQIGFRQIVFRQIVPYPVFASAKRLKYIRYSSSPNMGSYTVYARSPSMSQRPAPLRSLRDLRSRWVFAPARPRLARWEHNRPQGAAGHYRKWGHIRRPKNCLLKTLGIRQIVPTKFSKFKETFCRKSSADCLPRSANWDSAKCLSANCP